MKSGGAGIGSASILLVFIVLCLAIFAAITYSTARSDRAMTDAWTDSVKDYYAADLLAEQILCDILKSKTAPATARGVELITEPDEETGALITTYYCPASEGRELCVRVSISQDAYEILEWRMLDSSTWNAGGDIIIWSGA